MVTFTLTERRRLTMSRLPSIPSIELPETSSVGPFDLDCVMPYSRNLWGNRTGMDLIEIECMPGRIFQFHGEELRGPYFLNPHEEGVTSVLRRVCHILIDQIDAKGLE